ncbi:MAG: hypothetical protein BGO12_21450 [Verrucomicrobia bacterium 61-8]|nr:hypothetical protein [Verrucomicrobiota bacterium]OJU98060.1 MAG: hypothetical protein BGO12_21450 [Verrucomicrobia bacterium 61-8]
MVTRIFLIISVVLAPLLSCAAEPSATKALAEFKRYQSAGGSKLADRYETRIRQYLDTRVLLSTGSLESSDPLLVYLLFSRTHKTPQGRSYAECAADAKRFVESAGFERKLYQMNDLHPDQGRQSTYQFSLDDVTVRVELVPDNAITIVFFSNRDFRHALHQTRRTLIPPNRQP